MTTGGVLVRTRARIVVMGGQGWGGVVPGQTLRAAGKLRAADPGEQEAGSLAASTAPGKATDGSLLDGSAKELRARFVAASAFLSPDARGLLPGMVTGDTSALDEGLNNAMKAVGMTHLTAVSGANCSLVLGALLLLCRRFRLPRAPAAAAALAGLALFVVLVGPDASVLRAALMGAIGVASLAGGRSGRGLSFLCLAVMGLLLIDPALGSSFGFLLSVLATLGIILLGRRIIGWIPVAVPRWLAGAVAIPLSAQLLCGPVIVLLQPQFATYSLVANVVASPLVAPVTLLGTAAVPLVVVLPWAATALIGVAGAFSAGVAATARIAAQMPGSALPWPEGCPGCCPWCCSRGCPWPRYGQRPGRCGSSTASRKRTAPPWYPSGCWNCGCTAWALSAAWTPAADVAGWDTAIEPPEGTADGRCAKASTPLPGVEYSILAGRDPCPDRLGERPGRVPGHEGHGHNPVTGQGSGAGCGSEPHQRGRV
ncbi:ComEC/Rec2 family competence protein [Pseudarthrobacter sp. Fe7]|nr:ComEC/Rec2 family competence protein [Pseudarthrobacter sp. Fe7]